MDEIKVSEKHPLWLRCTHWIAFPLITLMVWSGVLIYWANPVYDGFFPDWFYKTFSIDHRLAEGIAVHFTIAWPLFMDGALYLILLFVFGHWREVFPDRESFRTLLPTLLSELKLSKPVVHTGKFNAAQRFAYTGLILVVVIEILSGFAIYKPVQLYWITASLGGYESARLIHFIGMLSIVAFFFIHVTQVARAGWNNFRSMVAGFEVKDR
jgi:thiosulfate reductase cytochrome b subunit